MADIDDSMAELKRIIEDFSTKQNELTKRINPKSEEIKEAWRKPSSRNSFICAENSKENCSRYE